MALAPTRNFDNFLVTVPPSDAVLFSGKQAEIRSDGYIRQDSGATTWGEKTVEGDYLTCHAPGARGARPRCCCASRRATRTRCTTPASAPSRAPSTTRPATATSQPRYLIARVDSAHVDQIRSDRAAPSGVGAHMGRVGDDRNRECLRQQSRHAFSMTETQALAQLPARKRSVTSDTEEASRCRTPTASR
jgi:hypothetical protein